EAVGRGAGGDQEDPVHAVGLAGGDPVGALVGDQVRGDDAGAAGTGQIAGEGVGAVGEDRVPVGHHQDRGAATREGRGRLHHVPGAVAAGQGGSGGPLDDRAVHDGIGVGQAQLDHVGAVVDQGASGVDGAGQVGVADGKVPDQGGASLGP